MAIESLNAPDVQLGGSSKTKGFVGVKDLTDAGKLATKRKDIDNLRSKDRQDWALNRAFYRGDQWSFYLNGQVRSLGTDEADKPSYRVRLTDNRVIRGCYAYIAQLTKTKPVINATPNSSSDRDLKAAQMGQRLFETWWVDFKLKSKLQSVLLNTLLDQGYWKITWDPQANSSMKIMLGPDRRPIMDDELSDSYRDEIIKLAEQTGQDPRQALAQWEQTVYLGDIRIDVMSGENVWVDPAAHTFEDANYAICKHPMDPDEIKTRYKKDVTPNAIPDSNTPMLVGMKLDVEKPKTLRDVYLGYFKPTATLPRGRYVAWIEGPDTILEDGDWPFPFDELPLVKFPGLERQNSALDEPLVTHVRPLQKQYNRSLSQITQHQNLTLKPQMVAPVGSLRQRLTDEPGAVFEYQPIGGMAPEWRPIPSLPPYVFEHKRDIAASIDAMFNSAAISRGQVPPNVEAGVAIDLLQEAAVDQVAPTIQVLEEALAAAGMLMVKLAQKFYIEPRLVKIWGPGGSVRVKKFMAADLAGGFTFHAEAGSGIPRTRAGRQSRVEFLLQNQLIDGPQALKALDVADMYGISNALIADEDMAQREHEKFLSGQPINIQALQETQKALQQGVDPKTGQPIEQEVQQGMPQPDLNQLMEDAAFSPTPYEDYSTHMKEHRTLLTSVEFEGWPPDAQRRAISHFNQTREIFFNLPVSVQPIPVRTSLSLKGTIGPTAASEILQRGGVMKVTPEQMAEPPLDTHVIDNLDLPNANASGNDPLSQEQQMQVMQQAQEAHDAKMAKMASDLALAHKREGQAAQQSSHADLKAMQQAHHAEQTHAQGLAAAQQQQDAQSSASAAQLMLQHQKHTHAQAAARRASQKPKAQ